MHNLPCAAKLTMALVDYVADDVCCELAGIISSPNNLTENNLKEMDGDLRRLMACGLSMRENLDEVSMVELSHHSDIKYLLHKYFGVGTSVAYLYHHHQKERK